MTNLVAAILNFVIWGSGYLYKRERSTLGWLLLLGYVLVHWYWLSIGIITAWTTMPGIIAVIGHLLISAGLAYDVYRE